MAKLWAIGLNTTYQTGLGTASGNTGASPVQIGSNDTWTKVSSAWGSSNNMFSFAIRSNGTLWSWGASNYYQAAQGSTAAVQTPTQVGSGTDWATLGRTAYDAMAIIKTNGTLWTIGRNAYGKTAQGTESSNTTSLTQVGSGTNWNQVQLGGYGGNAIRNGGELWGWGIRNRNGISTATTTETNPVRIGSDSDWNSISCGDSFGMGIKNGGELWGWGIQGNYQLGDGTTTTRGTPVRIGSATNWAVIHCDKDNSFGIRTDGTLWSWGSRSLYMCGDNSNSGHRTTPTQIGSATDWEKISSGTYTAGAVKTSGRLWTWGINGDYANYQGLNNYATYTQVPTAAGTGTALTAPQGQLYGITLGNPGVPEGVIPDITAVSFTGNQNQGQVLSGSVTESGGDPAPSFTYQWQRDNAGDNSFSNIGGATSINYTLQAGDLGNKVRLTATATNDSGSDSMSSSASGLIGPPYSVPVIASVTITGTAMENATLTASASASGVPTPTLSYQWEYNDGSGWTNIAGATSSTYVVTTSRIDDDIRCTVTATNSEGSDSDVSNTIGPILREPFAPSITVISISGTAQVGETLTGSVTADGHPTPTFTYQWQRWNGSTWVNIPGATAITHTCVLADEDTTVRFGATATNSEGSDTDYSSASATVVPAFVAPIISSVVVTGTAQVGETLTSTVNMSVAGYLAPSVAYQWQYFDWDTGWTNIGGATSSSYTITGAVTGYRLRLEVEKTNASGSSLKRSAQTAIVVPDLEPPVISKPIISGIPQTGQEQLASATATGYPAPDITYQWKRWNGATYDDIAGATNRVYISTSADIGTHLVVEATAENTEGTDTDTSEPTSTFFRSAAATAVHRFYLHTWDGTTLGELTDLKNVKIDIGLNKNYSLSFDTVLDSPMGQALADNDYLIVTSYRFNPYTETWQLLFSGPVFTKEENGANNTPTVAVSAVGAHWRLTKRIANDSTNAGRRQDGLSPTNDNLYIAVSDYANYRVVLFNAKTGAYVSSFGGLGTGDGLFNGNYGIASGPGGVIYVADSANDRIQKFTKSGTFIRKWGTTGTGDNNLDNPRGVAVDPAGNVWVSDRGNNRVMKYDQLGNFLLEVPASGGATMNQIAGVSVDDEGTVYVADLESGKGYYEISQTGELTHYASGSYNKIMRDAIGQYFWSGGAGNAKKSSRAGVTASSEINASGDVLDIAVSHDGAIFVLESDGSSVSEIKKYTADGMLARTIGSYGSGSGQTSAAKAIALVRTGGKDGVEIVSDLIEDTNTLDGNSWVRPADPQGTSSEVFIPKKSWGGYKKISSVIEDLQSGFEWKMIPRLATDGGGLVLGEWYGASTIGIDKSALVSFEYGSGLMNADAYSIKTSLENITTRASYPTADAKPYAISGTDAAAVDSIGVFEEVSQGGVIPRSLRQKIIDLYLTLGVSPKVLVEISPSRSDQTGPRNVRVPIPMIDYEPGDIVGINIEDNGNDRLSAGAARVYDISIDIDENGRETATLNLYVE